MGEARGSLREYNGGKLLLANDDGRTLEEKCVFRVRLLV